MGEWQSQHVRHRHKATASDTTLTHYGDYVPPYLKVYVALIAFRCSTTANADVVISIDGHGYDHVVGSQINMTATEWYYYRPQLWLTQNERLKFDWDGIVSGEVVEAHVTGHYQYVPVEPSEV